MICSHLVVLREMPCNWHREELLRGSTITESTTSVESRRWPREGEAPGRVAR